MAKREIKSLPKTGRAAVYVRLSKERERSVSLSKQREACEARVEALGSRYVYKGEDYRDEGDYYEDADRSAFQRTSARPAFEELIRRIKLDEYEDGVVVFYSLDRLVRRTVHWAKLEDLARKRQVGLISVTQPIDTTDKNSAMLAVLLAQFAQLEAETIGDRVRSAQKHLAKEGRYFGGTRPYGYERVDHPEGDGFALAPHPVEADIMRQAAALVTNGRPLTEIARQFNERGLTNRSGGPFRGPNLGKWLRNPALIGTPTYGKRQLGALDGERSWILEPVLPAADWRAVQLLLDEHPALGGDRQRRNDILLVGLVRCASCGHRMRGVTRAYGTYSCFAGSDGSGDCSEPSHISRDALDEFVITWLLERIRLGPSAMNTEEQLKAKAAEDQMRAQLTAERDKIETAAQRLEEREDDGEFDGKPLVQARNAARLEGFYERLQVVEQRLDELDLRARRLQRRETQPIERSAWDALDIFERRRILADFIDRVTIRRPANGQRSGPKAVLTGGRVQITTTVKAFSQSAS